jgi:hypothetical protein
MSGEPPKYFNDHYGSMWFVPLGPCPKSWAQMEEDGRKAAAKMLDRVLEYRKQQEKVMVRAKFKFTGIQTGYSEQSRELTFTAQYDETIPEDKRFAKATPSGTFKMTCDNPAANAQFELGKQYYFDISPAD